MIIRFYKIFIRFLFRDTIYKLNMPKVEIDYSNTIIYKIACKEVSVKYVYVGHTTNFVQKKHSHKQACNNINSPSYNLTLYKTIRAHGNWSNWDMSVIQVYNCKDIVEVMQKEQEHFISLNEPLYDKAIDFNQQENDTEKENFECIICDYNTCRKNDYDKHLFTPKHISNAKQSVYPAKVAKVAKKSHDASSSKSYKCLCGKKYVDNSGLWRHKKKCNEPFEFVNDIVEPKIEKSISEPFDKEMLIIQLLKQNQELQQSLIELSKKSINITNNNTSTTNSHNKTFNLQFFLNEECKDALNISEFVSSIKVELEDLETTGRLGYVEGVSRIMNKSLKELDVNKRPIHCSDLKREILYIKNDDQWIKEEETKPILKNAIKQVAHENIKQIGEWRKKYPDCTDADSRKNDTYLKIVSNSMSGLTTEEQIKNIDKIISKVAKESAIDK
jgi:hypothetical protein